MRYNFHVRKITNKTNSIDGELTLEIRPYINEYICYDNKYYIINNIIHHPYYSVLIIQNVEYEII